MRSSDSLKVYVGYFQSQLTKVHNYSENVSTLAFIGGLQVTHALYKYLMNTMSLARASFILSATYSQLEEVMKSFPNQFLNRGGDGENTKATSQRPLRR